MDDYRLQLISKSECCEITKSFLVSYVGYISKVPLRARGDLNRRFIKWFRRGGGDDEENMRDWIGWMLKCRNDLDKPSRDILTRFALSLVVEFGHKSCKKAKRIQHEMDKQQKEAMMRWMWMNIRMG